MQDVFEQIIPFENLSNLMKKIDRFNGKALKQKKDLIEYQIDYPIFYKKIPIQDLDGTLTDVDVPVIKVTLKGKIPKISGYTFLAKIEHRFDEAGKFIGNVVKTKEANVSNYFHTKNSECMHCKTKRFRKDTFILEDTQKQTLQVGKECLKDFISKTELEYLLKLASFIQDLKDEEHINRGRIRPTVEFVQYVAICLDSVKKHGYASKQSPNPTFFDAWEYFYPDAKISDLQLSEDNIKLVEDYINNELPNLTDKFSENLKILAKQNLITLKDCPMASTMAKAISKVEQKKNTPNNIKNEFNGKVGDSLESNVEVKFMKSFDTRFGRSTLIDFLNLDNNTLLKTFTTSERLTSLNLGEKVLICGKVKSHEEFNNRKSTVLTRVKIKGN